MLALSAVLTLSACGGSDEPQSIPTASSSPTTPTATPSPSPTESISAERAAAERALDRYLQVEAQLYADLGADPAVLQSVSYGLGLNQAQDYLSQMREDGITQVGTAQTVSRTLVERALRDDPPTLVFAQCTDGSAVEVLQNGEPFSGSTTQRNLTTYGVSYWQGKWQVSFIKLNGPDKC